VNEWTLAYEGFDPRTEGERETLCTLGNGYFATRGAAPEVVADGTHYPGTYVGGVYNRLASELAGHVIENESLVNVPNWLPLCFRAEGGEWFDDERADVLEHHLELDMFRGVLSRRTRFQDRTGRVLSVTQRRFVSMSDPHFAALETTLVPENWSGRLEVHSSLDGTVRNCGVARYQELDGAHLVPRCTHGESSEVICLRVETTQSHIAIAQAARTRLFRDGGRIVVEPTLVERPGFVGHELVVDARAGEEVLVEKVVSLFTSRDAGINEPHEDACDWVANIAGDFDHLLQRHVVSWRHLWKRAAVEIGADHGLQRIVNLHLFHLFQTVSNNSVGLDVGVPARGLHGEAYRGHVFWDDVFILRALVLRFPQAARGLLLYRHRRIDQARRAAAAAGYAGAMFPWQSASNGREETQSMHLNPDSGRWLPDRSHRQRHVNSAIAYNVWQYFLATGDVEFLRVYGAELVLEIARFWSSIAVYNHALDRYEITGVMGPDEYHDGYPDRVEPGLDNNAYTNLMAVSCLCLAFEVLNVLPPSAAAELRDRLTIDDRELDRWNEVSRKMRVCFHDGVISQFEGYELLEELDWDAYRRDHDDVARLDRILEAEGDSTNRYKVAKQADVMMLLYLLSAEELARLLDRLGYDYDEGLISRCIEYYEPRTSHGSTLSRVVHCWIHARRDRRRSWHLFLQALYADVRDTHHGTTREGVHLGAMAGTVDLLLRCYTGLELRDDVLRLHPVVPVELGSLAFSVRYRRHLVHLEFTPELARVHVDRDEGDAITVDIDGSVHAVRPGETIEVASG
jgi:trehalose/maltose hydrolase-like predicted phosphorylase